MTTKKRIGILEILAVPGPRRIGSSVALYLWTKQYASVMPQAIATWCRQAGHEVYYSTWYGIGDPENGLPDDLDVVFLSSSTLSSPVAYGLAAYYRKQGTTTVFGGPHAKSFSVDASRFFDLVVVNCDRTVIKEILADEHRPGSLVSTDRQLTELPTLAERFQDVRQASQAFGRFNYLSTMIPLISSVGCPYTCDFCTDWNTAYVTLPPEQLEADLLFASEHMPGVRLAFLDPNFGVRFDDTLSVIERVGPDRMNPYLIESSLAILKPHRLERLRDSNCFFIAPGIESWQTYGNKSGTGASSGNEKLERVSKHLAEINDYVPGMQYNLIFGLDSDAGSEPVALTKELMDRCAFGYPALNIPVPYGGTPMFDRYLKERRILKAMPLAFYHAPYLVTTLQNYDPVDFYDHLIDMFEYSASLRLTVRRLRKTPTMTLKLTQAGRAFSLRAAIAKMKRIRDAIAGSKEMYRFHVGEQTDLPEFYRRRMATLLGRWQEVVPESYWTPVLDQPPSGDTAVPGLHASPAAGG